MEDEEGGGRGKGAGRKGTERGWAVRVRDGAAPERGEGKALKGDCPSAVRALEAARRVRLEVAAATRRGRKRARAAADPMCDAAMAAASASASRCCCCASHQARSKGPCTAPMRRAEVALRVRGERRGADWRGRGTVTVAPAARRVRVCLCADCCANRSQSHLRVLVAQCSRQKARWERSRQLRVRPMGGAAGSQPRTKGTVERASGAAAVAEWMCGVRRGGGDETRAARGVGQRRNGESCRKEQGHRHT